MEMSRIDGFSDGVFGFALTLFVVSLEVPKNCTELHASLRGFLSICDLFLVDARPAGQADFCAQACEVAPLSS